MTLRLLLVTFSLRNRLKDYSPLFAAIRGNSLNWWHFIEQTVIVSTFLTSDQFAKLLYPHMETTDSLLVTDFNPAQAQGWLPPIAWQWFQEVSRQIREGKILPPAAPTPGQ